MLGTALSTLTGLFSGRFLRNAFFLAFGAIILGAVVAAAGLGRLGAALDTIGDWTATEKLLAAIALLGVAWFSAAVLESQTRAITQFYEGYWPAWLGFLASRRLAG